jgi:Transposase
MLQQACSYRLFVGIDVSSRTFTFASMPSGKTPSRAHTLEQTSVGFDQLNRQLLRLEPEPTAILVVMEATGTYWMRLALALCDADIAVAVVNPAQAHFRSTDGSIPEPACPILASAPFFNTQAPYGNLCGWVVQYKEGASPNW